MKQTNYLRILNEKEKEKIESQLGEQFGIKKVPGIILQRGEERLFLFSGNLTINEIRQLEIIIPIERIGIYFAKIQNNEFRLSVEGVELLKDQIIKNTFEINEEQLEDWMRGSELLIKTEHRGFLAITHKGDFLGCGKASAEKIGNYIPKARRLKEKTSL